jgi:hypothetical protein
MDVVLTVALVGFALAASALWFVPVVLALGAAVLRKLRGGLL